jgi:hypothetical protein
MIIVNPSSRSKTRIGFAYAWRMSSSLTPCLRAFRDDRVAAHVTKLACGQDQGKLTCRLPLRVRQLWTARRINEIVHGKRRITADTALRLGRYFGTTAQFWANLHSRYDLDVEQDNLGAELDLINPLRSA